MRSRLKPSLLPRVQRQLKQLVAIGAAVLLPFLLLAAIQQRRESGLQHKQEDRLHTLSAAEDAMLAIDELLGMPLNEATGLPGGSQWSAADCSALERISYRIDQVLSSGKASLPEDERPLLDRVRRLSDELSKSDTPPSASAPTRSLADVLRASLDQIRLLEQADFESENLQFQAVTRRILLFALPVVVALALAGVWMAIRLIRGVGRQLRLEEEIRETLARSEERYRSLFDGSLDAIFSLGSDGRFVTANPAAERLTGRTLRELGTIHFLELCAPDQREAAADAFRAAFCRECLTLDTAMIGPGGGRRELFISGAPTMLRGEVIGVACIARDVTERRQVEAVKNRERERLRRILDSQFGLVMVLSLEGLIIEINQAPLALMRKERTDVLGRQPWEIEWLDPKAAAWMQQSVRTAARGEVVRGEMVIQLTQIGPRDFDLILTPLQDETGRIVNVVAFGVDETERKQAEGALRESEMRLRTIFDSDPECLELVSPDGAILHMNPAGLRMLGLASSDQIRGASSFDLVDPAYRDAYRDNIAAVFRGESTHQIFETVPIGGGRRWMEQLGAPIWYPKEQGKVKQMLGVIRDITEQKNAESELRRLASIIEASSDFIGYAAMDGRFLYLNSAGRRLVGLGSAHAAPALAIADFVPEAERDFVTQELMPRLLQDGAWTGEFQLRHFGGLDPIPVDATAFLIRSPAGEPLAIANISRDVRERVKAERQANRSQRLEAIGTLAGGIAHDLNNALAPVLMGIHVLELRYPGEDEVLKTMESSCQRAADMVRQLLTFAKGASGQRILIQPRQLIREMQKIVKGAFPKNIQLRTYCPADVSPVLGDPTQLHQVLLNLCVNARDAMPLGGILSMTVEMQKIDNVYASATPDAQPGLYVCLTVKDSGDGIPPEVIDRIFEPFFTTKGPDQGTGLGLSTVLGIVKGHDGFIRVSSGEGQGTLFQIYLPAAEERSEDSEQEESMPEAFQGHGEMILIVDDEEAILTVARTILEARGFNVITAIDGAEGIHRAGQYRDSLRVAITDFHMPRMDGLAFTKALRPMCPKARIIVSSGRLEESAEVELKTLGIAAILHKPFTEDQLTETLRDVLQGD